MSLNKQSGNMYGFVTHTWNTVKGACPHDCAYCYMKKRGPQPKLHFDEKELKTDLGSGNFIFVGSSCDMWAGKIPLEWIYETLNHCRKYNNKYLFQSKNPLRIYINKYDLPPNSVIGTTIESNRSSYPGMGDAPMVLDRAGAIMRLNVNYKTMITIEPIINFDLQRLVDIIEACQPIWVNIGANTYRKVKLPEPSPGKVKDLIEALKEFTEVKVKSNLKRLMI